MSNADGHGQAISHALELWSGLDLLVRPIDWGHADSQPPHTYTDLVLSTLEGSEDEEEESTAAQATLTEASA